ATVVQSSPLLRRIVRIPELMVLLAILVVIVGFVIMAPTTFLSARNIGAFLTAAAQLGVVAVGAAILIIAGEFDISVGSNYAFTGIVIGLLSTSAGFPTWLAVIIGLLISTSIGVSNGLITLAARIPSFITTLGTWLVWFGLCLAVSKGFFVSVRPHDPLITVFGGLVGYQFYASIFWWLGIGIVGIILLGRTALGNWIFAVGGNADAARAVGVPAGRVKLFSFGLIGFLAGVSSLFTLGQQGSMAPLYGQNLALQAIAASVIGGCSLSGGAGSVIGAMLGAILMSMINSGLILAGAPTFWYQTFVGAIVIIAVVINTSMARRVAQMK
ncbi:MAG TPA: ABC transporter permease, partial [Candidatus Sulfotelmatobacter sp.]|nr:ABC transporter permease [Candidatus Sulfotelmatobacter sp.]